MTKFKVGDRVTFDGYISRIGTDGSVHIRLNGGGIDTHITPEEIRHMRYSEEHVASDTTFRNQAAIAALQGMLVTGETLVHDIAGFAFDYAEALDAERKKLDGGE